MKVALIILLLLSSTFILALLVVGIVGVIVAGQWRDIDEIMNSIKDTDKEIAKVSEELKKSFDELGLTFPF
jgi:hypothetical protein